MPSHSPESAEIKSSEDSISVRVKFFANLRAITKVKEITTHIEVGKVISHLMENLFSLFPGLEKEIYEDSKPKEHIQILVNGRNIKYLDYIDTLLRNNDVVAIFPPAAGG